MTVRKLRVLFLGQNNNAPKGRLAYGLEMDKLITTPFLSFLIQTDDQNILFDTGMHPENAAKAGPDAQRRLSMMLQAVGVK